MDERAARRERFLARFGWDRAARAPMTGDASPRRYWRLTGPDGSAVLMDAPPGNGEDADRFLRAGAHLATLGLSAPACYAAAPAEGLLLLEDLGRATFADLIAAAPGREAPLYRAATDILLDLHRHPPPPWAASYDAAAMAAAIRPARDWYLGGGATPPSRDWADLERTLARLVAATDLPPPVLLHRDFHAGNLIWCPERRGSARVGLLDFQDALAGSRAYDLASLLQDARRDVATGIETAMIARYAERAGLDPADFARAYAVQGAQRQIRILGIFARLAVADGKPGYLPLLPQVRALLERNLAHPDLAPLRPAVLSLLPAPGAAVCAGGVAP